MKIMKSTLLLLGLLTSSASGRAANVYRTDINPPLVYWQAFSQLPELSDEERKLYENSKTAALDKKYEALVSRYDTTFPLIGRAAHLAQRVDWGVDLADGFEALLPHLAKAKVIAIAADFRARYFLEREKENKAVHDLLGAFVLGRRAANDGILISALVQIAIENIVVRCVAENFYGFSSEALRQLVEGMDASPARGTVSQSIGTGERALVGWFANRISEFQSKHPRDEAKVMSEIREMLSLATIDEKGRKAYERADEFIRAGGGTSIGLLALVKGVEPLYDEMQAIAALPYDRFAPAFWKPPRVIDWNSTFWNVPTAITIGRKSRTYVTNIPWQRVACRPAKSPTSFIADSCIKSKLTSLSPNAAPALQFLIGSLLRVGKLLFQQRWQPC